MKCLICEQVPHSVGGTYDEPDVYEQQLNLSGGRYWTMCQTCGFYSQHHGYDITSLRKVYTDKYRDKGFRKETIKETFDRIMALDFLESENKQRVKYYGDIIYPTIPYERQWKHLDIGAGLGVFQAELKKNHRELDYQALEPNKESCAFINKELQITCHEEFFEDASCWLEDFDLISAVHVLEHSEKPDFFLERVKAKLVPGGRVFIEVPDSHEFHCLPPEHDEFNSCHLWFFDVPSLYTIVTRNGFNVRDIKRVYHKTRNLHRIMMVADA